MNNLTYMCDGESCERETEVRHERGSGVWCTDCAARRIRLAFDPDAEREGQAAAVAHARQHIPQGAGLMDYSSGDYIRPATASEAAASAAQARVDGGAGVIEVDGRGVYVA